MFGSGSKREFGIYNGMTDPEEFIKQFDLHALFEDWDDAKQAVAIKCFLSGKAEDVVNTLIANNKKTIKELKEGLINGCQLTREQRLQHFYDRKMKDNESIHVYSQALKSLFKKAMGDNFKPEDAKAFVQGQVINNVPHQFKSMLKVASCMGDESFEKVVQTLTSSNDQLMSSLGLAQEESSTLNTSLSRPHGSVAPNRNTFDGTCFNCDRYGHRIAFCDKPLRAKNQRNSNSTNSMNNNSSNRSQAGNSGNNINHYGSNRYQSNNNSNSARNNNNNNNNNSYNSGPRSGYKNSASNNMTEVDGASGNSEIDCSLFGLPFDYAEQNTIEVAKINSLNTKSDGAPLLIGSIKVILNSGKSKTLRALFDGGSTHSFISPYVIDDINNWSKTISSKEYIIKGAISTTQQVCKILVLDMEMGEWTGVHQFVVSNDVKRYDAVIGRDFFRKHGVVEDHGKDKLCIGSLVIDVNSASTGESVYSWDAGVHDLKSKVEKLAEMVQSLRLDSTKV